MAFHEPLPLDFRDVPPWAFPGIEYRSRCACGWASEWWRSVMNAARAFHWHASESEESRDTTLSDRTADGIGASRRELR